MKKSRDSIAIAVAVVGLALVLRGCSDAQEKLENAHAQVSRITADLDRKTTATGVYVRAKEGEINEKDPWGTPIDVSYSQGGVAEVVQVRSAGPDRKFRTDDDIVRQGMAMNFKGAGEGIKKNAEETASKVAKGFVKGTVEGVKDSIKEALPFKKKRGDARQEAQDAESEEPSAVEANSPQ